jgi:quercetin dioxygenase-like cupin family protein
MQQVISTTSARQQRRALVVAVIAVFAAIASVSSQAGQCPADKVVADGKGQPMSAAEPAKAVTDTVVASTDLAKEPVMIAGRLFRARKLEIAPGGVVPWHSHGDRPAQILIASGEITEYASTCAVPIVHKAGEITAEKHPTSHWWKNHGTVPVVIYSFDLFRAEDKKNDKMM